MRGFNPLARQVPKREAKVILLLVPPSERVPTLIFRLITRCLRLHSAALLSEGTAGSATKTNNSLVNSSMRRQSLSWTADGASRNGRQQSSNFCSSLSWARCLCRS